MCTRNPPFTQKWLFGGYSGCVRCVCWGVCWGVFGILLGVDVDRCFTQRATGEYIFNMFLNKPVAILAQGEYGGLLGRRVRGRLRGLWTLWRRADPQIRFPRKGAFVRRFGPTIVSPLCFHLRCPRLRLRPRFRLRLPRYAPPSWTRMELGGRLALPRDAGAPTGHPAGY